MRGIKYVVIAIVLYGSSLNGQSVNLPMDHWAYRFIDRMEVRGVISLSQSGSRPFTRETFADIAAKLAGSAHELTGVEQQYLHRLINEFRDDFTPGTIPEHVRDPEPHIYAWSGEAGRFAADALIGGSLRLVSDDSPDGGKWFFSPWYGGIIRGNIRGIGMYADNRIHAEWGDQKFIQSFELSKGYPMNASADSSMATWDESQSYLTASVRDIRFQFGRDRIHWGPSRHGSLMLSKETHLFDLLKYSLNFGPFTVTGFHGELRSDLGKKWFAARRLEISLSDRINLGIHESIVYGRRGIEAAYLNPLLPLLISEHTVGDKDNVAIGLDAAAVVTPGFRVYGELFIDDLSAPWSLFDDYWGNKTAFTVGFDAADPFALTTTLFSCEYTRLDPFVYTHHVPVNVYEHYNTPLGSALQPNSDRMTYRFEKLVSFGMSCGIMYSRVRHGRGDRRSPHLIEDGTKKYFLAGVVETTHRLSLQLDWEFSRDCRLNLSVGKNNVLNYQNDKNKNHNYTECISKISINW